MLMYISFFFFFFQAEDGIRDYKVTGVQTCALPICIIASSALAHHHAVMLPDWGQTTLLLNGAYTPSDDELAAFARRSTQVEATPIARLEGRADVLLQDGQIGRASCRERV